MPLFSGLYQVMNVTHNIKPNDMSTTLEGIKMRFDTTSNMRGIGPITLESLKALGTSSGADSGGAVLSQPNVGATSPNPPSLPLFPVEVAPGNIGVPKQTPTQASGGIFYNPVDGYVSDKRLSQIKSTLPKTSIIGIMSAINPPSFINPISTGKLISLYGMRERPAGKTEFHPGIDLIPKTGGLGWPILAAANGEVVEVTLKPGGGYGNRIRIKHNERFSTLYAHLQSGSILVKKGDKVVAGQKIAGMGGSGEQENSYGVHLHFEIADNKVSTIPIYAAVNPQSYILTSNTKNSTF
jgi:hypothetical protein